MCIFNKKRVNSTSEVKNMDKISVVVPCYNEEEALPVYYKEMCRVMDEMKDVVFELIFVDDGSSDATLGIMKDLNEKDSRCRYLSFSRNFGKEAAIYAGLKASEGDYVALMDVDLQDPPTASMPTARASSVSRATSIRTATRVIGCSSSTCPMS